MQLKLLTESHSELNVETIKRGIDVHVHFREPGLEQKETIKTGVKAAYAGGVGTVVEMPNTLPPVDNLDAFLKKENRIKESLHFLKEQGIEFIIHQAAALTSANTNQLDVLISLAEKAKIFKVFLANSTGDLGIDNQDLKMGLEALKDEIKSSVLVIFHAEDPSQISQTTSWKNHHEKRPIEAEVDSIKHVLALKEEYDLPMHITHVSTYQGAEILASQNKITWDVLPKHLEFSVKDLKQFGNFGVMNPPLRPESEREMLHSLFLEQKIPMLASDHAPHTLEEKKNPISGAPGVQELIPYAIDKWLNGEITKSYLGDLVFTRPKNLLEKVGLKIVEKPLYVDIDGFTMVDDKWLKSKCGWSLWKGCKFRGKILDLSLNSTKTVSN